MAQSVEEYYRSELAVDPPADLDDAYARAPARLVNLLYRPGLERTKPPSLEWMIDAADHSSWPLEPGYVPLIGVDDQSIACVVATPEGFPRYPLHGQVVRWHLTTDRVERQRDVLDTSVDAYLESVADELESRDVGLERMLDEIGPAYNANYLSESKKPRDFVVRPVRLACQNVIVGLAAFAQDASIDGLSVLAWQTCEVPHIATHEANRALIALTLCDAFKNGGTMEIRFDQPGEVSRVGSDGSRVERLRYEGHPEGGVPASLRRCARSRGVTVGADDPAAISPREARELFLAVTPMPAELRLRVKEAIARGLATPERLCFTLMSQLWREVELDFLLAVSDRSKSILEGGCSWQLRGERQAESQIARAARMVGMLYRRLDTTDAAAAEGAARVLEDNRIGVEWSVLEEVGAVLLSGVPRDVVPWQPDAKVIVGGDDCLVAVPRTTPTRADVDLVRSLQVEGLLPALVVPGDCFDRASRLADGVPCEDIVVLSCPERLAELDQAIESTLLAARMARQ